MLHFVFYLYFNLYKGFKFVYYIGMVFFHWKIVCYLINFFYLM